MKTLNPTNENKTQTVNKIINRYSDAVELLRSVSELEKLKKDFFHNRRTIWHFGAFDLFQGLLRQFKDKTLDEILNLILKGHLQNIVGSNAHFFDNCPELATIDQISFNTLEITLFTCFENFLDARTDECTKAFNFDEEISE